MKLMYPDLWSGLPIGSPYGAEISASGARLNFKFSSLLLRRCLTLVATGFSPWIGYNKYPRVACNFVLKCAIVSDTMKRSKIVFYTVKPNKPN